MLHSAFQHALGVVDGVRNRRFVCFERMGGHCDPAAPRPAVSGSESPDVLVDTSRAEPPGVAARGSLGGSPSFSGPVSDVVSRVLRRRG